MATRRRLISTLAVATGVGLGFSLSPQPLVWAGPMLEQSGTIRPAEAEHQFAGQAGEVVAITLDSDDFDPVLVLLNEAQEEIATNDDFAGSLNAKIVVELPADGNYTVVARSFAGAGGDYQLQVRTATPYEVVYAEAEALVLAEDYTGAIAAYTEAIALDPDQAIGYLGRAQATLGLVYQVQGDSIEGPEDIPTQARLAVIEDFEQAADRLTASGSEDWANSLREQVDFLRSVDTPTSP